MSGMLPEVGESIWMSREDEDSSRLSSRPCPRIIETARTDRLSHRRRNLLEWPNRLNGKGLGDPGVSAPKVIGAETSASDDRSNDPGTRPRFGARVHSTCLPRSRNVPARRVK